MIDNSRMLSEENLTNISNPNCQNNDIFAMNSEFQEYESIVNGTQGYILWGIVFVLIAFLGCIGNIVTIIVLKRDPIMTTLNILLIALAISDILAPQANALLAASFYHLQPKYGHSAEFLFVNEILRNIIQPLSTMFTMSSSWIVTTTTLFRLIAVLWPFKARTLINRRFAVISLVIIYGMSLAAIMPLYASLIPKNKCTRDKREYLAFDMIPSELMNKAYMPMMQVMSFYLPWLIALTLWIFLLRSLRRSERNFNAPFITKDSPSTNTLALQPFIQQHPNANMVNHNVQHHNSSNNHAGGIFSKRPSNIEMLYDAQSSGKSLSNGGTHILNNNDSRINNAQTRLRSYNRITLMVVVLCFTNLICRVFTFVFIFEVIYNQYAQHLMSQSMNNSSPSFNEDIDDEPNNSTNGTLVDEYYTSSYSQFGFNMTAKAQYPKFLAYSLLLNNIFLCINHSCNILIYTLTNPRFKKNLLNLLKSSTIWCCRLIGNSKTSLFNSNNANNVPQTPLTPLSPGIGSTKIVLPRNSMQSSLKNATTMPPQHGKRKIITGESESFKSSKNSRMSFRQHHRGDEKCVHYMLCFFCRKDSNEAEFCDDVCDNNQRVRIQI